MTRNTFRKRLESWLSRMNCDGEGLGIDLGTTRSCVALAFWDSAAKQISCDLIHFDGSGQRHAFTIPSAVARDQGRVLFGEAALEKRGQRGFAAERGFFYETKNTIGLRYTYPSARPGFSNATDIATHLLGHLRNKVKWEYGDLPNAPVVVACPGSFHASQRRATILAGNRIFDPAHRETNGWPGTAPECGSGPTSLLDEPYAAFIDLLYRQPQGTQRLLKQGNTVLVFDFGGGTCDVAIFRISQDDQDNPIGARLLATSRYHRLGGGDIDRAIIHEFLIPQLLEENGIPPKTLSWHDKTRRLEPALIRTAEELKLKMSALLGTMQGTPSDETDAERLASVTAAPLEFEAELGGVVRKLSLPKPNLMKLHFMRLLKPFIDPVPPPLASDEFVQRSSIFAPITHALDRARLKLEDIDGAVMCGCSSLLRPVQAALRIAFPDAACVLAGDDTEALKGGVARGAALQALVSKVAGVPLIAPECSSELSLVVTSGTVPLARAGTPLPAQSPHQITLHPPLDSPDADLDLSVEVLADGNLLAGHALWTLPAPVRREDTLLLHWQLDENQCLELNLHRAGDGDQEPFVKRFDSPIAHCDSGQTTRVRMLERIESIRSGDLPRCDLGFVAEQIARDAGSLGEYERALHFVTVALQERGDSPTLLNLRGVYRQNMGDREGAIEAYTEAAKRWSGGSFNLALMHYRAGNFDEALAWVDRSIPGELPRPSRVLRGDILDRLGRTAEARREWQDALDGNIDFDELGDFELGWLGTGAARLSRSELQDHIREIRECKAYWVTQMSRQGELPVFGGKPTEDPSDLV